MGARLDPAREERRAFTYGPSCLGVQFRFAEGYVEALLAKRGVNFTFRDVTPEASDEHSLLLTLKIDEYANRVRVHRWQVPLGTSVKLPGYDWFDMQNVDWLYDDASPRRKRPLWSFEFSPPFALDKDAPMADVWCQWNLTGTWRYDRARQHPFLELSLWFDEHRRGEHYDEDAPLSEADVLFRVPLDPVVLAQDASVQQGEGLRHDWSRRVGSGAAFEWEWYLELETFDDASVF